MILMGTATSGAAVVLAATLAGFTQASYIDDVGDTRADHRDR